jgi:nickel-dependent lactate racemase
MSAVITNRRTIGKLDTPTRRVINRAARMIDVPQSCFSMVVKGHHDLHGAYFGSVEEAQQAAARLSAQVNVAYVPRPIQTVISVMPELYDDIWTAGQGHVQDGSGGGRRRPLIIYAPHIDEVSYTHGRCWTASAYHVRDYFLAHMDELADAPRGVMAHATTSKARAPT